jgi:hypothetical protein
MALILTSRSMREFMRRWSIAAALLLGAAVLGPTQAEASCGEYVIVGGGQIQIDHSMMAHRQTQDHQDPAVPYCDGPSCSNRSFPPALPAPVIELTVERWAISRQAKPPLLLNSGFLVIYVRQPACDGFGLSILRPPR